MCESKLGHVHQRNIIVALMDGDVIVEVLGGVEGGAGCDGKYHELVVFRRVLGPSTERFELTRSSFTW
jgi:hypothetical protein